MKEHDSPNAVPEANTGKASNFLLQPLAASSLPDIAKPTAGLLPASPDQGPASTLKRDAVAEAAWERLSEVLVKDHPIGSFKGPLPASFLRPEAMFSFATEPDDRDFSAFHAEALLDQAADLLERAIRDRAAMDDLVAKYADLLLELHEFKDVDAIHLAEEAAGLFEVDAAEAKAASNAELLFRGDKTLLHGRLNYLFDSQFDSNTEWRVVEFNRRQGFASGVPTYYLVDQRVNCQEPSREALLETLRITLHEALEANRADARSAASDDFEEVRIAV